MTSILANTKITVDYYQTKNAMQQSLNIIKSYAKDSLLYGRKSGNKVAVKRGQEVGFAAANLEKHLQNLNNVVAKLKNEAIRIAILLNAVANFSISIFAKTLSKKLARL